MNFLALFLFRQIVSIALFAIGMFVARKHWDKIGAKSLVAVYVVRLVSMFTRIVVFNDLPPDYAGWYMHARWILDMGGCPGIDFRTPYYLGFNYLLAFAVIVFDNPFSICVLFIVFEFVGLVLLFKFICVAVSVRIAKRVLILYVTSPIFLVQSWMGGQDETISLCAVGVILWLIARRRGFLVLGLAAFLSLSVSKILTLFYLLPFSVVKRKLTVLSFVLAFVLYAFFVYAFGIDPFDLVFGREYGIEVIGDQIESKVTYGNFWSLWDNSVPNVVCNSVFLVVTCIGGLMFMKGVAHKTDEHESLRHLIGLAMFVYLSFNLLSPMTFSYYCIPMWPVFILFILMTQWKRRWLVWCVFSVWGVLMSGKDSLSVNHFGSLGALYSYNIMLVVLLVMFLLLVISSVQKSFCNPLAGLRILLKSDNEPRE